MRSLSEYFIISMLLGWLQCLHVKLDCIQVFNMCINKKYNISATVYDKRGRILSTAVNSYSKTHPEQKRLAVKVGLPEKEFGHAEVISIIRALKVGVPYSIKVERYGKTGNPLNAEPCPICKLMIKESGIKFVTHTVG